MAVKIARHFDLQLTQGAADAFVEDSILTGLDPQDGVGFAINRLEVLRHTGMVPTPSTAILEYSICRDSKLAVAKYDDNECIFSQAMQVRVGAAGMLFDKNLRDEFVFPDGLVVVEPRIWIQLDSNLTTVAHTIDFRLWYDEIKLTEVEILRLLNNV